MLKIPQQATSALFYIKHAIAQSAEGSALLSDTSFTSRLDKHFITLFGIFTELYGTTVSNNIIALIRELGESWRDGPDDLKLLDERRDANPEWFLSNKMLGGLCYVDRYAKDLSFLKAKI